jgi:hypothetical protein
VFCCGEVAGVAGVDNAVAQGLNAAHTILGRSVPASTRRELRRYARAGRSIATTFRLRSELLSRPRGDTIACRCEDVVDAKLGAEWSWRETKLRSRMGMGPCQGRMCGEALRVRLGSGPEDNRAPVFPSPVAALMAPDEFEV